MPFIKKKELERRKKVSEVNKARHELKRTNRNVVLQASKILAELGRRVIDLQLLAQSLWCYSCDDALSLRYLENEKLAGLASVFSVRCHRCLDVIEVASSACIPGSTKDTRSLYAVNCKAAMACVDSGVGHDQANKFLSAMNLPTIPIPTMKRAEKRIEPTVLSVAASSCQDAIALERNLTLEQSNNTHIKGHLDNIQGRKRPVSNDDSPDSLPCTPRSSSSHSQERSSTPKGVTSTPRRRISRPSTTNAAEDSPMPDESEEVDIVVSYDFGWDKRGNGFSYDSHSGRGTIIGVESGKVLGYEVVSNYCAKCARGRKPDDHHCVKNYSGSSKGMEPQTAVKLIVSNPDLKQAKCKVGTVTLDKDSSTMAALNRASPHPLKRNIDVNHNLKSFNNALWKMKKTTHKFLTVEIIGKLKVCLSYAIAQNKGSAEGVRSAILNIGDHCFGIHNNCGDWCKAKEDPEYIYKTFPNNKPFTCPAWKADLKIALEQQASQAEELAACGSSLNNESFNQMAVTRAPKSRHDCGTSANLLRVSAAVTFKNLGASHLDTIYQKAGLTPTVGRFRSDLVRRKKYSNWYTNKVSVKGRRLHLKMKKSWKNSKDANREGLTYVSGMGNVMERAAAASAVTTWLPEPSPDLSSSNYVIVDIETTGFHATSEIVQIAAKCGSRQFDKYIVPEKQFSIQASEANGMRKQGNNLWYRNELLETTSSQTAAQAFLDFLREYGGQLVLVGHNIVSFDAPRIVKWMKSHNLAKEFCTAVNGFVDTKPLIKQGKIGKQEELAKIYLTSPQWVEIVKGAHNAMADCILLEGLLNHFKISEEKLAVSLLSMRTFMERQAMSHRQKENLPNLKEMKTFVSDGMLKRMAAQGVTMEELVSEFSASGRKGLECSLGVQINGKPRVTKNKSIIDNVEKCVIQFLQRVTV